MDINDELSLIAARLRLPFSHAGRIYAGLARRLESNHPLWDDFVEALECSSSPIALRSSCRLVSDDPDPDVQAFIDHILTHASAKKHGKVLPLRFCLYCHRLVLGYKLCSHHISGSPGFHRRRRLFPRFNDVLAATPRELDDLLSHPLLAGKVDDCDGNLSIARALGAVECRIKDLSFRASASLVLLEPGMPDARLKEILRRYIAWETLDTRAGRKGRPATIDPDLARSIYQQTRSLRATASVLGCSHEAVRKALSR